MGTQFWWFYDAVAAAILLICIFIGGKKGFLKSSLYALSCVLALFIAYAVGGGVADSFCKNTILEENKKKIHDTITDKTFIDKSAAYFENMGYGLRVNKDKLYAIYTSGKNIDDQLVSYLNNVNSKPLETDESILREKIHEGYAVVIRDIISGPLNKYAAERAADIIREDSSGMEEVIPLFMNSFDKNPAAEYVAKHYATEGYRTLFRLGGFVALFIVFSMFFICCINALTARQEPDVIRPASRISGGFFGIISAAAVIVTVAAAVRFSAVMGSNSMLFFNNAAVEQTFVFKFLYNAVVNLLG